MLKLKKSFIMLIVVFSLVIASLVGTVVAYLVDEDSSTISGIVGEIKLSMAVSPEVSEDVEITINSPTFLLDPSVISLYSSNSLNDSLYKKHASQFFESCQKLVVTLTNDGNIPATIGHNLTIESRKGIVLTLEDKDTNDSQNDLAGIVFVILPHDADLEDDYYTYILDIIIDNNESLNYSGFSSLQTLCDSISQKTIDSANNSGVYNPGTSKSFDIFIWQEYYDQDGYVSQYDFDGYKGNHIYNKQEFDLKIKAYISQTGVTND